MDEGIPKPKTPEQKTFQVSIEKMISLFQSSEFRNALKETVRMIVLHRREIGFVIVKDIKGKKFYLSKPLGGDEESSIAMGYAMDDLKERLEKKGKYEDENWFYFGDLHFHGYEKSSFPETIIPSSADIQFSSTRETKFPSINIIANLISENEVVALLYQSPAHYQLDEQIYIQEELCDSLPELRASNATQEEVLNLLIKYGFKAGIVTFKNYELSEDSLQFIRSLETTRVKKK